MIIDRFKSCSLVVQRPSDDVNGYLVDRNLSANEDVFPGRHVVWLCIRGNHVLLLYKYACPLMKQFCN